MKNDTLQSTLAAIAEQAVPSVEIDLWPGMRRHLATSESRFSKGDASMKTESSRTRTLRRAALVLMTIAVAFAILFATPQGQAFAQSILQFFTRAESDTLPLQPFQLTPIPDMPTPDPGYIFNLDVVTVGRKAGLTVQSPTFLPEFLSFEGASYEPEHNIVRMLYRYNQGGAGITDGLGLREERFQTNDDCELCGFVGASALVEMVQIGNFTGEYVEGVWELTDKGPAWKPDPYLKTLRWQKAGMAFELIYFGLDVEKADLIAIAESIK